MSVALIGLVGLEVTPDPNVVQPGILPLLITIGLGAVIVLLYRSMKKQLKRINLPSEQRQASTAPRGDDRPRDIDITRPTP